MDTNRMCRNNVGSTTKRMVKVGAKRRNRIAGVLLILTIFLSSNLLPPLVSVVSYAQVPPAAESSTLVTSLPQEPEVRERIGMPWWRSWLRAVPGSSIPCASAAGLGRNPNGVVGVVRQARASRSTAMEPRTLPAKPIPWTSRSEMERNRSSEECRMVSW